LNPHEPCGPTDFKSGASASSATQANLFSTTYKHVRFRPVCVAYLPPMRISHFLVLQPLGFNHPLRGVTRYELHVPLRCFDVPMTKQALDASDIDTTHDPLRGSKMS
jgi:hypothetical protein